MSIRSLFTRLVIALILVPVAFADDFLVAEGASGHRGGKLTISLRTEPKTLNPVLANDISSREVVSQMMGDLIHINRYTQKTEPAIAKAWSVSRNGLRYLLTLRHDLQFSDGTRVSADDVLFSFQVYMDERVNSPQRDSLVVGGSPIAVRKIDAFTIEITLQKPYASAERLFDSIAILPQHLLKRAYEEGKFSQAWSLTTSPEQIAGLGPYRLKQYIPSESLTLERNPHYWKRDLDGTQLPYLDEITFVFVGNEDAEVLRFEGRETDLINRLNAQNFAVLEKRQAKDNVKVYDLGPGLEYNFLLFNLNSQLPAQSPGILGKQAWFSDIRFRQAVSLAVDREAMNKIIYQGRGSPIWTHVPPGNRLWVNSNLARPQRSIERARAVLAAGGYTWRKDGTMIDREGRAVEFTIMVSASSNQRIQMATLIQQDLKELGMHVQVAPIEFRAMLDRVFQSHNYEAAVMGLGGGDVDPNSQLNVWLSSGDNHLWHLNEEHPATPWEAEIDHLMRQQESELSPTTRKRVFDRVQEIEAESVPVVFLVSPNVLVGAKQGVRNFRPAVLDPHTLWNSDQLFVESAKRIQ